MIVVNVHPDFRFGFVVYTGGLRLNFGWTELFFLWPTEGLKE